MPRRLRPEEHLEAAAIVYPTVHRLSQLAYLLKGTAHAKDINQCFQIVQRLHMHLDDEFQTHFEPVVGTLSPYLPGILSATGGIQCPHSEYREKEVIRERK